MRSQLDPVSDHAATLSLGRLIFRLNYPATNEAMPPLVEGLCRHLADLQSGVNGQVEMGTS